ncbi:MAG: hypothetical protein ACREQ4_08955 [Candidatus Binataceae bacterium]
MAAGSGAWSPPFAQALPQVRITALDLPGVLEVTRTYAERYHVADPGNKIGWLRCISAFRVCRIVSLTRHRHFDFGCYFSLY